MEKLTPIAAAIRPLVPVSCVIHTYIVRPRAQMVLNVITKYMQRSRHFTICFEVLAFDEIRIFEW